MSLANIPHVTRMVGTALKNFIEFLDFFFLGGDFKFLQTRVGIG